MPDQPTSHFYRILVSVSLLATLPGLRGAAAEAIRLGVEFQVNAYTPGNQWYPAIAAEDNGDFVVVWPPHDSDSYGVFGRRFSSAGVPLGDDFQVNDYATGIQHHPAVAMDADGDFVAAWVSFFQDGDAFGVFARRFSSSGAALGGGFRVNTYTPNNQEHQSIAMEPDGDFVVAWNSDQDGSFRGVFGQRFNSAGQRLGAEFQVNTYTTHIQEHPAAAVDGDGDFVIAWSSFGQDGDDYGLFGQRFSSGGSRLGSEFQVNDVTSGRQRYPAVAADLAGRFVVSWQGGQGPGYDILARRFSNAADPLGADLQITEPGATNDYRSSLALDTHGNFIVVWSRASSAYTGDIYGRLVSSSGELLGMEFQVHSYTTAVHRRPAITSDGHDRFVVVWSSTEQDGGSHGLFAQRFAHLQFLDIDGDGSSGGLTDGLLVLRYLFGFRDAALIAGAVDTVFCLRCDAPAIEAYLASIVSQLDIDGDGEVEPLTDGLLNLRWLFGFTGGALVSGAVAEDCTRCDATSIGEYLATLDD